MIIRIIMVGKHDRGPVTDALTAMLDRARRMVPVEEVFIAEVRTDDAAMKRRTESDKLLATLEGEACVVVLDERGHVLTSEGFAQRIGQWRDAGVRRVNLVIGGAYGFDDRVRARATLVLALSAMTFPHQLVRLILAEQVYRALSILRGAPYHH